MDSLKALRQFVGQHATQRAAAKALGITPPHLTDLLYGRRRITDGTLAKLGYERREIIRRKETQ